MSRTKDRMLDVIRCEAERDVAHLAGEFAHVASEEKEALLGALEFEKWLAESCRECLGGQSPQGRRAGLEPSDFGSR